MTINTIKNRVKRLEQLVSEASNMDRAEQMRLTRLRRLAMSPAERVTHEAQRLALALAALTEPDLQGDEGRAQRMRRSRARRHLESPAP